MFETGWLDAINLRSLVVRRQHRVLALADWLLFLHSRLVFEVGNFRHFCLLGEGIDLAHVLYLVLCFPVLSLDEAANDHDDDND